MTEKTPPFRSKGDLEGSTHIHILSKELFAERDMVYLYRRFIFDSLSIFSIAQPFHRSPRQGIPFMDK